MKEELELELVKKYPNLYKEHGGDPAKTCMAWGIACGDGWYKLIDELSAKLEPLGVVAAQVKEKFGGLRFYLETGSDEAWDLVSKAEEQSYKICERCGETGRPRGRGWIKTLCDECEEKDRNNERL
jgi:hypothetical protein